MRFERKNKSRYPKCVHPDRIAENARFFDFELASEDVVEPDGFNEGFRRSWDPTAVLEELSSAMAGAFQPHA